MFLSLKYVALTVLKSQKQFSIVYERLSLLQERLDWKYQASPTGIAAYFYEET